jgi:WXXGXW repeat (2 copies)
MKNTSKALALALLIAGSAGMAPTLVCAAVGIDINIAPPAPRVEVVPGPRAGFVWAPGYWDYRRGGHVWVPGRWVGERRGYHWAPDRWDQRGPRWHHERGHWER